MKIPGKLDYTKAGIMPAILHGIKIYGWHLFSYAIILFFAEISGHLNGILALAHTPEIYLPLIAASLNASASSAKVWLNTHAPATEVDPVLTLTEDGESAAGFTVA